jgi:hypothetical protein
MGLGRGYWEMLELLISLSVLGLVAYNPNDSGGDIINLCLSLSYDYPYFIIYQVSIGSIKYLNVTPPNKTQTNSWRGNNCVSFRDK